ncbi:MAG: hypothetical protein J7J44_02555 [Deltaproteobacteria bacterium]|nr:hypothetical protein [Deltaproteobacteria bacterium]
MNKATNPYDEVDDFIEILESTEAEEQEIFEEGTTCPEGYNLMAGEDCCPCYRMGIETCEFNCPYGGATHLCKKKEEKRRKRWWY